MRRSTWNNLRVLFFMRMNIKFLNLLNPCMVWNKHLKNDTKILILLYYLMILVIIILINVYILKFVITIQLLFVSKLILTNDMKGVIEIKRFISFTFKMKDHGQVDTILGIKVRQHSESFTLSHLIILRRYLRSSTI